MEASVKYVHQMDAAPQPDVTVTTTPLAGVEWVSVGSISSPPEDREQIAFVGEVSAGLPAGEDLAASECRVDYLLELAANERTKLDRLEEFTARRVQMVLEHKSTEAGKIEKRLAWLEKTIREHMPHNPTDFKKTYGAKSHRFPHGHVGYRQQKATVQIVDPVKALAFAQSHGLEVTVKQSVGKTPLHEFVIRNGEDPDPERDGFVFVPASDSFFCAPDVAFL